MGHDQVRFTLDMRLFIRVVAAFPGVNTFDEELGVLLEEDAAWA